LHFHDLFFYALQKKQIDDDEIFQTTRFTRPSRPSVKELMLHSIRHDIERPTHRYHNAFIILLTLVRQRALQSWALYLHCRSFAYRLLLIFLP